MTAFIPTSPAGAFAPRLSRATTRARPVARRARAPAPAPARVAPRAVADVGLALALSSPALDAAKLLAGPGINVFNFAMVIRIILTWYPRTDLAKQPWIFVAVPTEPLLRATRKVVKPLNGVDISPIVWFAIMSFVHEILVGPQGLLVLLSQK